MKPLGGFEVRVPVTASKKDDATNLIQQILTGLGVPQPKRTEYDFGVEYVFGRLEVDISYDSNEPEPTIIGHFEEEPNDNPLELRNFTSYSVITHLAIQLASKIALPTIVGSQRLGLNFAILEGHISEFILDFWDYVKRLGRFQVAFRPIDISQVQLDEIEKLHCEQIYSSIEEIERLMSRWSLHLSKVDLMKILHYESPSVAEIDKHWRQILDDQEHIENIR